MDIKKISEVIAIFKKNKYKAYLVGGSARDFIFSRDFTDIDIATNAPLSFISKNFKVENDDGSSMGSIKIVYKNLIMEITRFRKEKYTEKSTFPKIDSFLDDPSEDALRRDFTINAIYLDPTNNQVIDPFDGIKDLFSYKIKFIGNPIDRINEDPSRILRGIRLAYKLNFTIEETTKEAFLSQTNQLERLSNNRYNKEINKMIEEFGESKTQCILKAFNIKPGGKQNEH